MSDLDRLMNTKTPFLTDGGFETWLFFQQGFDAPEFAAIVLMDNDDACVAMRQYFDRFLGMAFKAETGFVLDTNTWRGGFHWGSKLGQTTEEMRRLNIDAVNLARDISAAWQSRVTPILLNGVVGPSGDGYEPGEVPDTQTAYALHRPQIETLSQAGVDMISAITMTNIGEATGIVQAAVEQNLPVVISFTVETDGRIPTGETLGDAIRAVDAASDSAPAYYMVNCAHPEHFHATITSGEEWVTRIGGIRANASRLSHAELDEAETLDEGDPDEFGKLHLNLAGHLPGLRVVGGCCGTDHRHVGCVSRHLHAKAA